MEAYVSQPEPEVPRRGARDLTRSGDLPLKVALSLALTLALRLSLNLDGSAHCAACSSSTGKSSSAGRRLSIVSPEEAPFPPVRDTRRASARRAASCSASFLVLPMPR